MDAPWRIQLLGCLRASQGDWTVTRFRSQRTAALLAYLAYFQRRPHPREELIELFWPEIDFDAGRNGLRVALSSLRHQLEPPGVPPGAVLAADRMTVQLSPGACTTDVAQFEAALQAAVKERSGEEQEQRLVEAVEGYGGALLPGYFEEWILPERQRLSEAYLQALERLSGLLERRGELQRALQHSRRGVAADPLHEEAHRDVMRLLIALGQPQAALRQYRELERLLSVELDAVPASELRVMAQEAEQLAVARDRRSPAHTLPPSSPAAAPVAVMPSSPSMPTGTVTFLLVDTDAIAAREPSSPAHADDAGENHLAALRELLAEHQGHEVQSVPADHGEARGASFVVAFQRADRALAYAVAAKQALMERSDSEGSGMLRVRMALHTGDLDGAAGDYEGPVLICARRVLAAGHPDKILCSEESAALVRAALEPGVRLVDLGVYRLRDVPTPERLFHVEYPGMVQDEFPPLNAAPAHTGQLPLQFTRFFGREEEIERLLALLLADDVRLVTLTGPGGSGKSRLALEVAQRLQEPLRGAVWFASLVDLSDAGLILDKTLDSLRLPRSPHLEPLDQVVAALSRQRSLLLLDSFEHLVAEGAALVQELLQRAPSVTVLVTSRQRLGLAAEREYPVYPLPVPGGGRGGSAAGRRPDPAHPQPLTPEALLACESVRLFVDRAQAARPDFQVTPGNVDVVASLCERLEGIPLALELAAARARMLTPQQMLARLAGGHEASGRFELLVSLQREPAGRAGGGSRHRSLRATLDWSYQLLPAELQRIFARLSVFRGGWTLDAAEAVCMKWEPATPDRGVSAEPAPERRPESLDRDPTLAALEQLRDCSLILAEASGGAEMRYRMLETVREYASEQMTPDERYTLARRHACFFRDLAERAEPELWGVQQAAWLERLEREHDNLRAALVWAEESREVETGLRLAGSLWEFWAPRGYIAEGRERLAGLLRLTRVTDRSVARARALACAGVLAQFHSDYASARSLLGDSLAIRQELGDRWGIAFSLTALGFVARYQGDYDTARQLQQEGLNIWRELGIQPGIAWSLSNLAAVAGYQGDSAAERALHEESLAIRRGLGDQWGTAFSLSGLGSMALAQGDVEAARSFHEESLLIRRQLGDQAGIAASVTNLGRVALRRGDVETARSLLGEGLSIRQQLRDQGGIADSLFQLGVVSASRGEWDAARALLEESLSLRREFGDKEGTAVCLEQLAGVNIAHHRLATAAQLFGAADALREAIGAPLPPIEKADLSRELADVRARCGDEAFAAAWAQGRSLTWREAAELALRHT